MGRTIKDSSKICFYRPMYCTTGSYQGLIPNAKNFSREIGRIFLYPRKNFHQSFHHSFVVEK